jgi:hypothetical protein
MPDRARRAIREMLAFGLNDPYSRFITPEEFRAMRKYDVTGVGLNLATAEEFTRKSGMALPPDRADVQALAPSPLCTFDFEDVHLCLEDPRGLAEHACMHAAL